MHNMINYLKSVCLCAVAVCVFGLAYIGFSVVGLFMPPWVMLVGILAAAALMVML